MARPAKEITLAELIDATEGPVRLAPCVEDGDDGRDDCGCGLGSNCPIQRQLNWLHGQLRDFFQNLNLATLARAGAAEEEATASGGR